MGTPVIVDAVRTPQGKRNGVLAGVDLAVLLGVTQAEVISRAGIDADVIEQVIGGCVTQAGEQSNNMVRRAWVMPVSPTPPPPPRSTRNAHRRSRPPTSSTP